MNVNHLSKRLSAIAKEVPLNSRLADIGSDHAYLPIYLALNKRIQFGVVGEIAPGPLSNAEMDIRTAGLGNVLMPRLADGLAAIHDDDNVNVITIAGMGGSLITTILEQGISKLVNHPRLILQPNVNSARIREWLVNHHYQLRNETILEEDGHIYEVLVADAVDHSVNYTPTEIKFGPYLLQQHSPIFITKWQDRYKRLAAALTQMQTAKQIPTAKVATIKHEMSIIKEVL